MAATPLSRSCSIRIVSVHLLDAAGRLLRVLFLDREGHISAQPHYVPREEALILASNSSGCSAPRAWCRCSEGHARRHPRRVFSRGSRPGQSAQPIPTYTG